MLVLQVCLEQKVMLVSRMLVNKMLAGHRTIKASSSSKPRLRSNNDRLVGGSKCPLAKAAMQRPSRIWPVWAFLLQAAPEGARVIASTL